MPTDQPFEREQLDLEAHVRQMVDEIERGEEEDRGTAAEKPAAGERGGPVRRHRAGRPPDPHRDRRGS